MLVTSASSWKGDLEGTSGCGREPWARYQEIAILDLTPTDALILGKLVRLSGIRLEGTSLLAFSVFLSDIQSPTPFSFISNELN